MAMLLKIDGSSVEVEPGGPLTVEWLQGLVEGYVELVRCADGSAFAVDVRRSVLLEAPFNRVATLLAVAKGCLGVGAVGLRGPVVFLSAADVRGFR